MASSEDKQREEAAIFGITPGIQNESDTGNIRPQGTEPVSAKTVPEMETGTTETDLDCVEMKSVSTGHNIAETKPMLKDKNPEAIQTKPEGNHKKARVNKQVCVFEEQCKLYDRARNDLTIAKAKEIQEKMVLAKNILHACQFEQRTPDDSVSLSKLHRHTNLQNNYLVRLTADDTQDKQTEIALVRNDLYARSMRKAIKETQPVPLKLLPFIYGDIRDVFVEYYVEKKQLPSLTDLLSSLQNIRHNIYIRDNLYYREITIRTLVKNDFIEYHHFPRLNRYMITENPRFMYKRHIYLSQIMKHRKEERPIVYVAIKKIDNITDKCSSFLLLAASSSAGLIARHDAIEQEAVDVINKKAKQWIQNLVVPKLKPGSVVVLTQPGVINTIPTPYSKTDYIKAWLQDHDIPFDDDEQKASLYRLVKIFQKQCKDKGLFEDFITNYGFDVVVCPPEYERLDYYANIYNYMRKSICSTKVLYVRIFRMISKLSEVEWVQMENQLIEEERQIMEEDNQVDKIVENIFQMVKNGDASASDFPNTCSGTKADNFLAHIGDFIVD